MGLVRTATAAPRAESPDEERLPLAHRVRIGLWLALLSNAAFALADLRIQPPHLLELLALKLVSVAAVGVAFWLLSADGSRRRVIGVALAAFAVASFSSAFSGGLIGDAVTTPILCGGVAMVCAALLPWGTLPQLAAAGISAAAIVTNLFLVEGPSATVFSYPAVGVVFVLATSVYIAGAFARLRAQLADEERRRAEAEAALRASEADFRGIVENLDDPFFRVDLDGTLRRISPTIERYGYRVDRLVGGSMVEMYVDPSEHRRWTGRALEQDYARDVEVTLQTPDGGVVPVAVTARVVRDADGAVVGFEGLLRDISKRRRAEEAVLALTESLRQRARDLQAANEELQAFSYSVSHDLRGPLQVIESFTQLVLQDAGSRLDADNLRRLERVAAGAQAMARLIDDLLALARTAQAELYRRTLDLSAMARSIAADLRAREPGRRVTFVIADGVTGHGDEVLLRSVLHNLLENAWKFTAPRTQARIEFGVLEPGRGGGDEDDQRSAISDQRVFFVRDNGVGFDPARADQLFRPFQRLHPADEFKGTGIGLATVERIIHRHGGRVWAEGEPNRGATVYFTLGEEAKAGAAEPGGASAAGTQRASAG